MVDALAMSPWRGECEDKINHERVEDGKARIELQAIQIYHPCEATHVAIANGAWVRRSRERRPRRPSSAGRRTTCAT
eukprot:2730114-Pyramimonas_sp.AAC.1